MPRTIDRRDFSYRRGPEQEDFATQVRDRMADAPTVRIERVHPFTRSAVEIYAAPAASREQPPSASNTPDVPDAHHLIAQAQEHLRQIAPALGFAVGETPEFIADPLVKETSMGWRVVNLQQHHQGIPVFQMERAVVFDQAGSIRYVTGDSVGGFSALLPAEPTIPIKVALTTAAAYLALPTNVTSGWTQQDYTSATPSAEAYRPRIRRQPQTPAMRQAFERGPFRQPVPAHLVYFYLGHTTRLGWYCVFSLPEQGEQYAVILEADAQAADLNNPQILYCTDTVCEAGTPVRGNVWTHNPSMQPDRRMLDFPRPLTDYPINPLPTTLPPGFPPSWVDATRQRTEGNNVEAFSRPSDAALRGNLVGGVLTFDPADRQSLEQCVLNAFYFCNFMHDFYFMLGFDERAGNFQQANLSGAVAGQRDVVQVEIVMGQVPKTAFLETGADGTKAIITLGFAQLPDGSLRHTALDSDIVFHEYTHGVTKRLVGNHSDHHSLEQGQSLGLGEGWSDYFALTVQNAMLATEKNFIGDWVFGKPNQGQRLARYDDAYAQRGTFGKIGKPGDYVGRDANGKLMPHPIGEIWCATLMKMNRDLGQALGNRQRGHFLGWQIVIDGLKSLAANPSFLDARNGILQAFQARRQTLTAAEFTRCAQAIQGAFQHFGMGQRASCNGNSLLDIVEDTVLPPTFPT